MFAIGRMIEDKLPPKIHNAYWFQAFNAVSWQICLGTPLILFGRELGAPAVVLGLLAGLSPLTSVLQLPVAPHAERIGYRNLMVKGWSARVFTLIFLALLPLTGAFLPDAWILTLTVVIMLAFTLLRGVATCAWLPWISSIVPRSLRGVYLSRDRTFVNLASVAALTISGLFLFSHSDMRAYSIVFGISYVGGMISLYFLKRIPVPPPPSEPARPKPAVPWLQLLADRPFLSLLTFSVAVQVCVSSTATFVTVFVRNEVNLVDGTILWLTAGAALIGTVALTLLRNRVDRLGSRPFLGITFLWWVVYYAAWFLMAANLVGHQQLLAALLLVMSGFFAATYDLALTRLLMNTVGDRPASAQYFALHSVIVSLLAGTAPILWGFFLDRLDDVAVTVGGIVLSGYSIFFGLQWLMLAVVLLTLLKVKEANCATTGAVLYHIFIGAPTHRIQLLANRTH